MDTIIYVGNGKNGIEYVLGCSSETTINRIKRSKKLA